MHCFCFCVAVVQVKCGVGQHDLLNKSETNMKLIIFLFGVYLLVACSNSTSPKLGEEIEINYGQCVSFQDNHLTIKFVAVEEDSRCPEGAVCVWEGNGRVAIEVSKTAFVLNTSLEPKEIEYKGYKIRLTSLLPYPKLNKQVNTEDYSIKIIVIK
jgi:hypothetical protein